MSADAFHTAMQARGLHPPQYIEPGKLIRCASSDRTGDMAGWCKLFDDQRGGVFGDWREGWQETWQAERDKPMDAVEHEALRKQVEEARQQRDAEDHAKHESAAERAASIWQAATDAPPDHAYLRAKRIKAHGARIHDGALLVPIRIGAELHSLQFIAADGGKKFLSGGRIAGGYFGIGKPDGVLCIAEGLATGASIHEATGFAVAVAFNAGNLLSVAKAMRERFPKARLILCADDDAATKGNPGLTKARAAAEATGGQLAVPDFGTSRQAGATDFNDLAQHAGADAVRRCIERAESVAHAIESDLGARAILQRGDAIQLEPINWLWEGWMAAGKLHILAGAPGTGKTTIALAMAAAVTVGGRWPDGTQAELGSVVIWSGEDDPADTLAPRLKAMNADMARVHFVEAMAGPKGERMPFDPARDVAALSAAMASLSGVRLLIVDPIVSAVAGDSHNNAETRRSLQPLVDLAAHHRCALIGITHLSKGTAGRDPVERVSGSLAFGALARVVLLAAKQQAEGEQAERRLLMRAKSNIGPDAGAFVYDLRQVELPAHPGVVASAVLWGNSVDGTARELLTAAEEQPDDGQRDAADFLRELLADGSRSAKEVFAEAQGAGYSRESMYRAKRKVGVETRKQTMLGGWVWSLEDGKTFPKMAKVVPFRNTPSSPPSGDEATSSDGVDL